MRREVLEEAEANRKVTDRRTQATRIQCTQRRARETLAPRHIKIQRSSGLILGDLASSRLVRHENGSHLLENSCWRSLPRSLGAVASEVAELVALVALNLATWSLRRSLGTRRDLGSLPLLQRGAQRAVAALD